MFYYWPFQGGASFEDLFCCLCFAFVFVILLSFLFLQAALWSPAGKGLTSWLFCVWCFFVCFFNFPIWCLGSGVELYCIDSWSLPFLYFYHCLRTRNLIALPFCGILRSFWRLRFCQNFFKKEIGNTKPESRSGPKFCQFWSGYRQFGKALSGYKRVCSGYPHHYQTVLHRIRNSSQNRTEQNIT